MCIRDRLLWDEDLPKSRMKINEKISPRLPPNAQGSGPQSGKIEGISKMLSGRILKGPAIRFGGPLMSLLPLVVQVFKKVVRLSLVLTAATGFMMTL